MKYQVYFYLRRSGSFIASKSCKTLETARRYARVFSTNGSLIIDLATKKIIRSYGCTPEILESFQIEKEV